ncbi:hypothetical protein [Bdellovibrio sp. HCB288]|uniref:hypothetical protein n=1 Tax=Bdellovibrio sp. HCB288 TaxID=3394355 RepID=UPI0039B49B2E
MEKKAVWINFKSRYKDQATVIEKPHGDERNRLMLTGKKWDEYVNAEYVSMLEDVLKTIAAGCPTGHGCDCVCGVMHARKALNMYPMNQAELEATNE